MIRDEFWWARFPALFLSGVLTLLGCSKAPPIDPGREGRMVYVDAATDEAVVGEIATEFPAVHPRTGKRTLMPAMYCEKCGKWHPVPPPDQINRVPRAAQCPKTGAPLVPDGPWPGEPAGKDAKRP